MSAGVNKPQLPLVVYTDLDGTLLDHDTYSFQPALPALQRLQELDIPVIPVTSKTLAELDTLTRKLNLSGPCIAENGGLIAYPPDYFPGLEHCSSIGRYRVQRLSPAYQSIVATLNQLRAEAGYLFEGFSDLSAARVAQLTGLAGHDAELARQRLCSEPLVWQDSEEAFKQFSSQLETHRYTLVRGGRFWHVMGQTDKAVAIKELNSNFSGNVFSGFTTVALGDSPNDIQMLLAADIAVVIRRKDGSCLAIDNAVETYETKAAGPEGWNEFFQTYLDGLSAGADNRSTKTRTRHG